MRHGASRSFVRSAEPPGSSGGPPSRWCRTRNASEGASWGESKLRWIAMVLAGKRRAALRGRAASADVGRPRCAARLDRGDAEPGKEPSVADTEQNSLGVATRALGRNNDRYHNRAEARSRQRRSGGPMPCTPGLVAAQRRREADSGKEVSWQPPRRRHASQADHDYAAEPEPDRLQHECQTTTVRTRKDDGS